MHERITEDRVFGQELRIPAPVLLSHRSTSFDVFSTVADGVETAYASQGTVNHPPLLFLHGWGASHKFWLRAFTAFSPRFRCLAPDLPGFGLSEKPSGRDWSMDGYVRWLGAFLDMLRLPRVTLVGHSMGATIALQFAAERPDRVAKLALANPVIRGSGLTPTTRFRMNPLVRPFLFMFRPLPSVRRWAAEDFTSVEPLPDELIDDIAAPTYRSATKSFDALKRIDLASSAGSLSMPVLAIGTDRDAVVAADQLDLLPTARRVTIRECGHIPQAEKPEEFNRALDDFLRE